MIEIMNETLYEHSVIDQLITLTIPSAIGVTTGSYGSIVHLPADTPASEQTKAQNILSNFGALSVSADKTIMDEGDADPVIICDDADMSSDVEVGYVVLMDGIVYATGTATVVSGEATLNLISPVAGVYEIFVYRNTGNYASGSVTITVNEVS